MSVESTREDFTFQAEISRLLHLLSESLYQNREITIRELVSNASDALDKLRHASLTDASIDVSDLKIEVQPDKVAIISPASSTLVPIRLAFFSSPAHSRL